MFSKDEMPSIWDAVGPVGGMGASDQRASHRAIALKHTDATTRRASDAMARKVRRQTVMGVSSGYVRNTRPDTSTRDRKVEKRYRQRRARRELS